MSSKDFYNVKCALLREKVLDSTIALEALKKIGRDVAETKQNADLIFDFVININTMF